MIIGETTFPKNIPNLNHSLFKGVNILELVNPRIKKNIEIIKDQSLTSLSFVKGYKVIIKKTIKKTMPKLRFELILISSI
tara:strand:+ start:339 stop:578 length:240 start_codon:yes stop_codon:yes gene_type:complete